MWECQAGSLRAVVDAISSAFMESFFITTAAAWLLKMPH